MNAFKLFDAYSLRARLFPALWASASVIAAIALIVPWHRFSIFHAIGSVAVPVVLFAMADLARRIGKIKEPKLYERWGGMPTTNMMRHADSTLDAATKAAYVGFVAGKLNSSPPTAAEEVASPDKADAFYSRCAAWLRENTRDVKKFTILFNENVTYGYRRNLFALKWPALAIDLLILFGTAVYMFHARHDLASELGVKLLILVVIAVIHAAYMAFASTEASVREAANIYARQLLLSCDSLESAVQTKRRNKAG